MQITTYPGRATPDGEPGTTKITVKVSDDTGRLIPPGNGSDTAGQSFMVTASLTPTEDVSVFVPDVIATDLPANGSAPTTTFVTARGVDGASTGVRPVDDGAAQNASIVRYDLTIGTDSEGSIARVHASVKDDDDANVDLMRHNQKLEFLLRGDDRFQISRKGALQAADIILKSGATLVRDEVVPLTLQVNELGNVGANNEIIDLKVLVVSGGEAPMLDTAGLDAHFAANPVEVREHKAATDAEDVATAGLPIDFGSFASHGGGQAITYKISPDTFLTMNPNTGHGDAGGSCHC